MEQKKIGAFLKELRGEQGLTQEQLAEKLQVSGRTVSRWETGSNMPDISLLVELADFYQVSIPEIIDGERKSETMNQETKDTAIKMAEYSKNETKVEKRKIIATILMVLGGCVILAAFGSLPSDSSWGSIYATLGGIIFIIGLYQRLKGIFQKKIHSIGFVLGCMVLLFGLFSVTDYLGAVTYQQVPRFRYQATYISDGENTVMEYKTLFFTAVRENPDTEKEVFRIE